MQVLEEGKQCGSIMLRNFPETGRDKKQEKREVLLTVILASNLSEEEQERRQEAEIVLTKTGKGKKNLIDFKISMPLADALLRQLWSRLEKACNKENVKRYQIEAITPNTPVKEKPQTEFRKARKKVREIMKEKEQRHSQEKKDEEKQRGAEVEANLELPSMTLPEKVQHKGSVEHVSLPGSEPAAVLARLQESRETRTSRSTTPGVQQEGGAGPGGLPASRAAVVMASQKESRETETSGVLQQAERGGRDTAAAEVLVQEVQELVIDKKKWSFHRRKLVTP